MSHPVDPARRRLLLGAVSGTFALAVRPVAAETITTSTSGLEAGDVSIPTSTGDIPAYFAAPLPKGKRRPPVVLVVQEIFGVHEHIRDVCRRLAKQGYFAIATELMLRQGDVKNQPSTKEILPIVAKVPDAQVLTDLDATVGWVERSGKGDVSKLAITGFCWGGRITWLYAAHRTDLKAGVAWYGRLDGEKDSAHPRQPLELVSLLNAPVLGLYGAKDQAIPLADVDAMKQALAQGSAAAKASSIHVYPEAGHAFLADYRPTYVPAAASDGWSRMLGWLKAKGV